MENNIKQTFKECVLDNIWFKILSLSSIILIFISLFLPPMGTIDPSVIAASGELIGWGALWTVLIAMKKGKGISVKHGETEITINGKKYKLDQPIEEPEDQEEINEE